MIFFQFLEGYYITKEAHLNNNLNIEYEMSFKKLLKKVEYIEFHDLSKKWEFFYNQSINLSKELKRQEINFKEVLEKYSEVTDLNFQKKELLSNIVRIKTKIVEKLKNQEKNKYLIKELKNSITKKQMNLNSMKTILKNNSNKFEINNDLFSIIEDSGKYTKEYTNSSFNKTKYKSEILKYLHFVNNGKKYLEICNTENILIRYDRIILNDSDIICNVKEKESLIKFMKKNERYCIVLNALKYKKIAEISFVFFNNICEKFYIIPAITDDLNYIHLFYEKYYRELSVMTGVISHMLNFLSFAFNIPLKYPILLNGSKSYIFKNKKE